MRLNWFRTLSGPPPQSPRPPRPPFFCWLEATNPSWEWHDSFVNEVARMDAAIAASIQYYGRLPPGCQLTDYSARFGAGCKADAQVILHPFLHPKNHKHFLTSVAEISVALVRDPRVYVICDTESVDDHHDMEVYTLLYSWRKDFGDQQILDRNGSMALLRHTWNEYHQKAA